MGGLRAREHDLLRQLHPEGWGERVAAVASTVTGRGAVWIGFTVLAHRSSHLRAAGHHGLAGWTIGSALAFVVKSVMDRRRPSLPFGSGPSPSSSSMPSSHTAGAVAYATAASMTTPAAAPVPVALAGLVAWSRLATGRHFPTDVAAGAAIGVAGGYAAHRLLQRLIP